jgi:hypothetical protein
LLWLTPWLIAAAELPDTPEGYRVAAADGAWVFRPIDAGDLELAIRVFGPFHSGQSLSEFLLDWLNARPGRDAFSPPTSKPNLSVTTRETRVGAQKYIEACSAIRSRHGELYIEQLVAPTDRATLRSSLTVANGEIAGAIFRGELVSPPPGIRSARQSASAPAPTAPSPALALASSNPLPRVGNTRSMAAQNVSAIDSIGFDNVTHLGYGGYLTFDPTPLVLFKSGEAVDDMTALNAPEGLAAHQAAHPRAWLHWRRSGNSIEVDRGGTWKKLYYTKTLGPAPAAYRLNGDFQRLSGGGNLAVGGTASVLLWNNLSFDSNGTFASGGGSGSATETSGAGGVRVATSGRRPDAQGTYHVSGYLLTLHYASGRVEQRAILVDPKEPDTIWLDGEGWSRP